jgi:hypothetical protein
MDTYDPSDADTDELFEIVTGWLEDHWMSVVQCSECGQVLVPAQTKESLLVCQSCGQSEGFSDRIDWTEPRASLLLARCMPAEWRLEKVTSGLYETAEGRACADTPEEAFVRAAAWYALDGVEPNLDWGLEEE